MRNTTRGLTLALAAAFMLAAPVFATGASDDIPTEKLWQIECTGIGGWGAASKAIRVRAILEKQKGVLGVDFDTTGSGYLRMKKKATPDEQKINEALAKSRMRVKVKKLEKVELIKTKSKYELTFTGVAWQGSCIEIREILKQIDNVTRVHPYGQNGKVVVHATKKGAVTKKQVEELLKDHKKIKLRKMKRI